MRSSAGQRSSTNAAGPQHGPPGRYRHGKQAAARHPPLPSRRTSANRLAASRPACCSLDVTQLTRMPRLPTVMPGREPLGACR